MSSAPQPPVKKKLRVGRAVGIAVAAIVILSTLGLEWFARRTRIEAGDNGVSVIEPRGFFARGNVAAFLRIGFSQWVRASNRNEFFMVGDDFSLTANDPNRDGRVDEIYLLLRSDALNPHVHGADREFGGLRLFFRTDANGAARIDAESLAELQRVMQALFDDGMRRHADELADRR